jgi:hypothetical protein
LHEGWPRSLACVKALAYCEASLSVSCQASSGDVRETMPACLHVYVEDADMTFFKALATDAKASESRSMGSTVIDTRS